jgi:hypothetical protein
MARMNGHGFPPLTGKATSDTSASADACGTGSSTVSTPGSTVHYLRRARPAPVQFPSLPPGWPDAPAYMADQAAEDAAERAANLAIDGLVARAQHINGLAHQANQQADQHDVDACLRRMREVYASSVDDAQYADQYAEQRAERHDAWLAAAEPIERRHPWLWPVYVAAVLAVIALSALWPMGWAS